MIKQRSTATKMDSRSVGFSETAHAFAVMHRVKSRLLYQLSWERAMYGGISAANYAASNIEPNSVGHCAECVRKAIEWGGISLRHTRSAKDYGLSLLATGFHEAIDSSMKGGVIMIRSTPGHPHEHMAIYNSSYWISDFKQLHGFYPGPAYRSTKPAYKTYRYH